MFNCREETELEPELRLATIDELIKDELWIGPNPHQRCEVVCYGRPCCSDFSIPSYLLNILIDEQEGAHVICPIHRKWAEVHCIRVLKV